MLPPPRPRVMVLPGFTVTARVLAPGPARSTALPPFTPPAFLTAGSCRAPSPSAPATAGPGTATLYVRQACATQFTAISHELSRCVPGSPMYRYPHHGLLL